MGHYLKSKPGSIEEAVSSVQSRPFIEDKEAYTKFFNAALKKFKVKSPAEFKSDEEKKKFFDYIDKNYKSDAEKKTGKEDPKESKTLTGKKMSEVETNKIDEGTTKLPDSMAEFRAIADMMKKPIKAKDANKAISKYIVDDSMAVGIQNIAKKNPNADARPVIAKVFNKLKIYTKGEPSYGSTIKFNRKFEISDRDQKKYLDRPSSKDLGNMGFVKTEGFDDDLISLASKHISQMSEVETNKVELGEGDIKKTQVKRTGNDFNIFYKGNTKYGRNKMIGYFVFDKGTFEVYHDNSDKQNDFQQNDMVKTAKQALELIFDTAESNGVIKENIETKEESMMNEKKLAGFIAFYGDSSSTTKKVEIPLNKAPKGIYQAKQIAMKMMNVPKSKQGLLAIEPAYEHTVNEKPFKEENELIEKVDKKLALKILSMMKNQKFKKTSGDFVPQIYLSGMDRDKLKKEFGRLPRGLPSASSGVPVVDFINHAMGISKTVDGIDTEDGDKPQPKLYDYRSGKVIGKPKTVGDAAKMAGLRLEEKKPFVETMRMALSQVWGEAVEEKMKNEQRRVPDATIKKFADMTDKNQHTEVRLQIAKIVGDKNLIKKYEKLKKDQDKAGSLTGTLQKTRQTLDKELLSKAFDELGNARQVMGAL